MMAWCSIADVVSILGQPGTNRAVDDDRSLTISPTETANITSAIDRAASYMYGKLSGRYSLPSLASNEWCRWCNAQLAVCQLLQRRANAAPKSQLAECDDYKEQLTLIRRGKAGIPDAVPTNSNAPQVKNYDAKLRHRSPWVGTRADVER